MISYRISRQKIGKGYISYILSNFILSSKTLSTINFYFENIQYTTFLEKNMNRQQMYRVYFCKYLLTISPHNKCKQKLHCAKEKTAAKFKFVLKQD
jgi:hypothetical protein